MNDTRDAKPGDRFHYGGRWYVVTAVDEDGFDAFDGGINARFTFEELESPDQWRVVHLCTDACEHNEAHA